MAIKATSTDQPRAARVLAVRILMLFKMKLSRNGVELHRESICFVRFPPAG